MSDPSSQKATTPWYAAYPPPKSDPASIRRTELLQWFHEGQKPGKDFMLIDLRRTDHEGGTIHGSINLLAQSLYPTIQTLYALFTAVKIEKVVGSSRRRGNHAAGWFADYIVEKGDTVMRSCCTLEDGINGWAPAGEEYVKLMDEYCEAVWTK